MKHERSRNTVDIGTDGMIVAALVTAAFLLQAWHLKTAFLPATDEGVYALIGRLMLRGAVPHSDFPMWHMPLLPFLTGVGLWLTNSLFAVRVVFLAANCLAVFPLYATIKKLTQNPLAAVTGVAFYLTFHEMMAHDFRMLAIRQAANVLFILFVWAGVCAWEKPWREWLQLVCCVASAMLFLPAAANMAAAAAGLVFMAPAKLRKDVAVHYGIMLCCAAVCAVMYLLAVDGALREVVFEQLQRTPFPRWARIPRILAKPDALLMAFGTASLLIGPAVFPKLRPLGAASLAVVLMSVFLSTNYFDHYISLGGPSLALGVAMGILLIQDCITLLPEVLRQSLTACVCTLLVLWQWSMNVPMLIREWQTPNDRVYREMIDSLSYQPEPVLLAQALFAAEANRLPVMEFHEHLFRPPMAKGMTPEQIAKAESDACTIVIDSSMKRAVSANTIASWQARYNQVFTNAFATILVTGNPGCDR